MCKEELFLESEISEIKSILLEIPEDNIIDRMSLKYRLEEVQEELKLLRESNLPEKISITFKGKPVHGVHGINADFAAKITGVFSEAYATFVEVAKGNPLGSGGTIPEYDKHKLIITGTAVGSFGFELELPKTPSSDNTYQRADDENPIQKARLMLENVIENTYSANDDQLSESIECIDQRALDKVNEFYEILNSYNALFSLKTKSKAITCYDKEQIKYAVGRLKKENITEDHIELIGSFRGYLPARRDFEFHTDDNNIIIGKVNKNVQEPEMINSSFLNKNVKVKFTTKKVGNGKPRYTLLSVNDIAVIL